MYWIHSNEFLFEVPDIYKHTLDDPIAEHDIEFWMNVYLGDQATCVNAAVEESMLRQRDQELLARDLLIRDNIRLQDVLLVSVGAYYIALKPLPCTLWHMLQSAWSTPRFSIENGTASSQVFSPYVRCRDTGLR